MNSQFWALSPYICRHFLGWKRTNQLAWNFDVMHGQIPGKDAMPSCISAQIPLVLSFYLVKLIPNSFWLSFCEQWFFSFLSARRTWKIMIQQSRTSINYILTQVNKTKDKLPKQQQKISIFTDWHSYSIPVITNANKTIANKSPTCQPTLCAE